MINQPTAVECSGSVNYAIVFSHSAPPVYALASSAQPPLLSAMAHGSTRGFVAAGMSVYTDAPSSDLRHIVQHASMRHHGEERRRGNQGRHERHWRVQKSVVMLRLVQVSQSLLTPAGFLTATVRVLNPVAVVLCLLALACALLLQLPPLLRLCCFCCFCCLCWFWWRGFGVVSTPCSS